MHPALRVGIVCFCGGVLGALLAHSLGQLWPLGALAGGSFAWFIWNPMEVWRGLVHAVVTTAEFGKYATFTKHYNLYRQIQKIKREDPEHYRWAIADVKGIWCFILVFYSYFVPVMFLSAFSPEESNVSPATAVLLLGVAMIACGLVITFMYTKGFYDRDVAKRSPWVTSWKTRTALRNNSVSVLIRLIMRTPTFLYEVACVIGEVAWTAFKYIHSEMRLLVFVDATLGACVGWYASFVGGSPLFWLIGGIAGALFGVINYEFVSKRWLKLAPR